MLQKKRYLGYREWAISTHQSNVEAMDWLWHDSCSTQVKDSTQVNTWFGDSFWIRELAGMAPKKA